jgi:hypothetical protein
LLTDDMGIYIKEHKTDGRAYVWTRRWDGSRCRDLHTKFHNDWFMHFELTGRAYRHSDWFEYYLPDCLYACPVNSDTQEDNTDIP